MGFLMISCDQYPVMFVLSCVENIFVGIGEYVKVHDSILNWK